MVKTIIKKINISDKDIIDKCYNLMDLSFERGQLHVVMSKNQRLALTFLAACKNMDATDYIKHIIDKKLEEFISEHGDIIYKTDENSDQDKHVFYIVNK